MPDQLLNVTIRFNKDTGALELAKQDVSKLKQGVDESTLSMKNLYTAALAFGAFKFAQSAIEDAIKFDKSLVQVSNQMKSLGIATQGGRADIIKWSEAIQASTRFSNDEAVAALSRVIGATKDLGAAQRLVKLSMDVAVATGRDQNEVLGDLQKAYIGNERGVKALKMALGDANMTVGSTNDLIRMLESRFGGVSQSADSADKKLVQFKNQLNDVKRTIGEALLPVVMKIPDAFKIITIGFTDLGLRLTAPDLSSVVLF